MVETWVEMKVIMRKRFVPSFYYRETCQKLQALIQGTKSVDEYYKEMEMYMIRAIIKEDEESTMARFLNGLNKEIANMVELQHYVELEDMVHTAMKVERQLKRMTSSYSKTYSSNYPSQSKLKGESSNPSTFMPSKPQGNV